MFILEEGETLHSRPLERYEGKKIGGLKSGKELEIEGRKQDRKKRFMSSYLEVYTVSIRVLLALRLGKFYGLTFESYIC